MMAGVPRTLGTTTTDPYDAIIPVPGTPPPCASEAKRITRPGWRDPRLWIGIAVVAACVVAGARLIGAADNTVQAWALADHHAPGDTISEDDLVPTRVRFTDAGALDSYFRTTDALPKEVELVAPVGPGELLPRSAVGPSGTSGLVQIPLTVDPGLVPPGVEVGSLVDIYVTTPGTKRERSAQPVLERAPVVANVPPTESFSATGLQQVTVAVPEHRAVAYFRPARLVDSPVITIVRRSS